MRNCQCTQKWEQLKSKYYILCLTYCFQKETYLNFSPVYFDRILFIISNIKETRNSNMWSLSTILRAYVICRRFMMESSGDEIAPQVMKKYLVAYRPFLFVSHLCTVFPDIKKILLKFLGWHDKQSFIIMIINVFIK